MAAYSVSGVPDGYADTAAHAGSERNGYADHDPNACLNADAPSLADAGAYQAPYVYPHAHANASDRCFPNTFCVPGH